MMGEHLPIGRGPRPWREPRAFADWVVTLAWLQLTSLIAGTAMLAFLNWALADLDAIACFDRDRAACGREESARWFGLPALAASVLVYAAAVLAVVIARRHRAGMSSRRTALGALALPVLFASAAALMT